MNKGGKHLGLIIFAVVIAVLIMAAHARELNNIPGVNVTGGEVVIDIGDFHYHN